MAMTTFLTLMYKQDQVEILFKSLNLYFLPKQRVLKQVEVWERVIYLRFEGGSPTFFSKKEAAFISQINLKAIHNLLGFTYIKKPKPKLVPKKINLTADMVSSLY